MSAHKVLLVGPNGGRESALAWKFRQDGDEVIHVNSLKEALDYRQAGIDLAMVSSDDLLAAGTVDQLKEAGFEKVFGPSRAAAQLEASKAVAKSLMTEAKIVNADYQVFDNYDKALGFARDHFDIFEDTGLVIKADGLAQGKGVSLVHNLAEAESFLKKCMLDGDFGKSGNTVIIEEILKGKEMSVHALVDSKGNSVIFPLVADHKAVENGDKGPNTGGMGVFGFLEKGDATLLSQIKTQFVDPIIKWMGEHGMQFMGLLYPGLMQQEDGSSKLLEYNVRFGDPEAQVYMRLLDSKLFDLLDACITGTLSADKVKWKDQKAVSVTLASDGYPGEYQKGKEITGIDDAEQIEGVKVFAAGMKQEDGKLVTSGGRVMHVTATGDSLKEAKQRAYAAVDKIHFEGMHYRTDIGEPGLR